MNATRTRIVRIVIENLITLVVICGVLFGFEWIGYRRLSAAEEQIQRFEQPSRQYYSSLCLAQYTMIEALLEKDKEQKKKYQDMTLALCKQAKHSLGTIESKGKSFDVGELEKQSMGVALQRLENLLKQE